MKHQRILLYTLCLLFKSSFLLAQPSISVTTTEGSKMATCAETIIECYITNNQEYPIPASTLDIDLAVGITYVPGTVNGDGVSEINGTSVYQPVFQIPTLLPCTGYQFSYKVKSACGVNGETLSNVYTFDTSFGEVVHHSDSFSYKKPKLQILDVQVSVDSATQEYSRTYIIGNIGNKKVDYLLFRDIGNSESYDLVSSSFGTQTCVDDVCEIEMDGTHFNTIGNNDPYFDPGELIEITQILQLVSCYPIQSYYFMYWQCEEINCALFDGVHNIEPYIGYPSLNWQYDNYAFAGTCSEGYVDVFIINEGTGPAKDLILEPGMHIDNSDTLQRLDCPRLFDFSINDNPITVNTTYEGYGLELFNQNWNTDPDGPGGLSNLDGDGQFDDLLDGDTIRLRMKVQFEPDCLLGNCDEEILSFRAFIMQNHYTDFCGFDNIVKYQRNDYSYEISKPFDKTNMDGDRIYLDSTERSLNISLYRNMTGFPEACTNDSASLHVYLPATLELLPGLPILVDDIPVDFIVNGNEITITGSFYRGLVRIPILITCDEENNPNATCTTEFSNQPGYHVSYDLFYYCDKDACSIPMSLYCEESECFRVGDCFEELPYCSNPCPVLFSHDLAVQRVSLGWTDSTLVNLVDPNNPSLNLNFGMSFDTLHFKLKQESMLSTNSWNSTGTTVGEDTCIVITEGTDTCLIYNNVARLSFEGIPEIEEITIGDSTFCDTTYINPFELLEELPITVTFFDVATNQSITCDASNLPFYTLQSNSQHYAFEITDLQSLFDPGGCLSGFEHNPGDTLEIDFYARVLQESMPFQPYLVEALKAAIGTNFTLWSWSGGQSMETIYLSNGTVKPFVNIIGPSCYDGYCTPVEVVSGFKFPNTWNAVDLFPQEFRPLASLEELTIQIPLNLSYENNSSTLTYWRMEGDEPQLVELPLPDPIITNSPDCDYYEVIYQNDGWPLADYISGKSYEIKAIVNTVCPNGEKKPVAYSQKLNKYLYTNEINQGTEVEEGNGQVTFAPRDFIVADPVFDSSTDSVAQWIINICNPITYDDSLYTLYNNWLAFEFSNNNLHSVIIEKINDPLNPDTISLTPYGSTNSIWGKLGDLESDTCFVYRISAIASSATPSKIDLIQGMDCAGYPTAPDQIPCFCEPLQTQLCYDPVPMKLVIDVLQQPDSMEQLCTFLDYEIQLSNINFGVAYYCDINISFPFETGLEIVPGSAQLSFPQGNGYIPIDNPNLIAPAQYQWPIMDFIDSVYLTGIDKSPYNSVLVKFQLQPNCDFQSGSFVRFDADGRDLFGAINEAVPVFSKSLKLSVQDSIPVNNYDLDMAVMPKQNCDSIVRFRFSILNQGGSDNNLTSADESLVIIVNNSFDYLPGSIENINNFPQGDPEVQDWGDVTYLTWPLPPGIAAGDSMVFDLKLSNACGNNCNLIDLVMQTKAPVVLECPSALSGYCELEVLNKEKSFDATPISPNYIFTAISATTVDDMPGYELLSVDFELMDTSAINGYGDLNIDFYLDGNNNGQFDDADSLLWTEGINASGILAGETASFGSSHSIPVEYLCSIIAVLHPENNDCICYASEILIPAPEFQIEAPDLSTCYGSPLQMNYPNANGYSIEWSNSNFLDNNYSFTANYQYTGPAGPNNVITEYLIATVSRPPTCTNNNISIDTILVSTYMIDGEVSSTTNPSGYHISCANATDGSAAVTVNYGTAPFIYEWSNGSTESEVYDLAEGIYYLTITDARGCMDVDSLTLASPPPMGIDLQFDSEVNCYGGNDGAAVAMPFGGNGAYQYYWSSGATTNTANNLSAGWAYLTVTDEEGCEAIDSLIINEPPALALQGSLTATLCHGDSTGSIDLFVTGGTAPYSYQWNTGDNSSYLINLAEGTYNVTLTDVNGCLDEQSFEIGSPPPVGMNLQVDSEINCYEGTDGVAQVSPFGGTGSFQYNWSNGSTDSVATNLTTGWVYVTVTDEAGCANTGSLNLGEPPAIAPQEMMTFPLCHSDATGSIELTQIGGTAPYTYQWSTGSGSPVLNDLAAGIYYLTLTDIQGCIYLDSFEIESPLPVDTDLEVISEILCYTGTDGVATVSPFGGTGSYEFSWSNGSTESMASNLSAGWAYVTVTDEMNCSAYDSLFLEEPPELAVQELLNIPLCNGDSTGSIALTTTGGTAPFNYNWNNGTTADVLQNVAAGSYFVTVTDANNCSMTASYDLVEPLSLELTLGATQVPCYGDANGSAYVINESGGVGSNYNYQWSNGALTDSIYNLNIGTYTLTITDANGCTWSEFIEIEQPEPLLAEALSSNSNCVGNNNGTAEVINVAGGTAPYTYLWSDATQQTTKLATNLYPGIYEVSIADQNDCLYTTTIEVGVAPPPVPDIDVFQPDCIGDENGMLEIFGLPDNFQYGLNNTPFQSDPVFDNLGAGVYTMLVEDEIGCVFDYEVEIQEPMAIDVFAYKDTTLDLGQEVHLKAQPVLRPAISFEWTPSLYLDCTDCDKPVARPMEDIIYTVEVTDIFGCTALATVELQVRKNHEVYVPNAFSPNGDGINDVFTIYGGLDLLEVQELQIYDRWGEHIFTNENFAPNETEHGWDGTLKNQPMNPAVFVYWARLVFVDGREKLIKGDITLIR